MKRVYILLQREGELSRAVAEIRKLSRVDERDGTKGKLVTRYVSPWGGPEQTQKAAQRFQQIHARAEP